MLSWASAMAAQRSLRWAAMADTLTVGWCSKTWRKEPGIARATRSLEGHAVRVPGVDDRSTLYKAPDKKPVESFELFLLTPRRPPRSHKPSRSSPHQRTRGQSNGFIKG